MVRGEPKDDEFGEDYVDGQDLNIQWLVYFSPYSCSSRQRGSPCKVYILLGIVGTEGEGGRGSCNMP